MPEPIERVGKQILDAAFRVHRELGPGFLEKFYEEALCIELAAQGIPFVRQKSIEVYYRGHLLGRQRLDIIVDEKVIVEVKAVEKLLPVHEAQLISYLQATGLRLGFLINFQVHLLKHGLRRIVR
ncbi:MAG TPA: GxxExxY protein [Anaerolineae bacterium]|nr:GxxExxY protein [Anaerolineae bacterium]